MVDAVQLPHGSTGFWSPHAAPPVPVDIRTFKALGYSAAHVLDGRVLEFQPATALCNFHRLTLQLPTGDVGVICHALVPMVAFVAVPLSGWWLTFLSRPDLAPSFFPFEALTAEALNTPVSRADLSQLAKVEHQQIDYWRPDTVGQILFNYWD